MITLSTAKREDVPAIAELAAEMDRFYGATEFDPPDVRKDRIGAALFGDVPSAYALLAWDDGRLVGFASYSFLWPAVGLTGSMYLKELYVCAAARRGGVGAMLMRGMFAIAVEQRCSRVEWTTDHDNEGARAFYEAMGVAALTSKVLYRLEGDDLRRAASQSAPASSGK